MNRWSPRVELTKQEKMLMKRLTRVRALFGFLRQHRHELFDDTFQDQLEGVYRVTGAGEEPHPPALLCIGGAAPGLRRRLRRRGRGAVACGPSLADGPRLPGRGDSAVLTGGTPGVP